MFGLLASFATNWRRCAVVIVVWAIAGAAIVASAPPLADVTTNDQENFLPDGSEVLRVNQLVREKYPRGQGIPAIVVFHRPEGLSDSDLAAVAGVDEALQAPDAPADIQNVVALSNSSPLAASSLLAPDGTTVTTIVTIRGSPAEEGFREAIRWIRDQARDGTADAGLTVAITGPAGIISDAVEVFSEIDFRVTLFTVLLVLVLLLLIYRSPALALLPLVGVGLTLVIAQGVAATLAANAGLVLNSQVTALMSVLMFGAGTDFTLFIVARYREELRQQPDRWRAMQVAIRRVGPAIASSAGTTIAAMLALLLATFGSFQTLGPVLALAIFLMLLSGLTLIPAMAVLLGRAAFWPGRMHVTGTEHSRIWSRVADIVARRPVATFIATLVLLVVFAAGAPTINPNFSFIDGFPDDAESKIGAQIMDDSFGAGELAPTNVYVNTDNVLASLVDVDRVAQAVAEIPGVTRVSGPTRPTAEPPMVDPAVLEAAIANLPPGFLQAGPPTGAPAAGPAAGPPASADPQAQAVMEALLAARRFLSPDGTTARLDVVMGDDPYGIPAIERIDEVRAAARGAVEGTSLDDAEVLVGGPTALQTDAWASVNTDVRFVGPIVVVLIWIILLVLLRSLVAATYLIGSVLLSFLSALGISVVIFQNLMGHPGVGYQNAVWMFIFLAALGADYNILIMTRVREEIRARGLIEGTRLAVARTGGVITSAGLILAGTFSILATLPLRDIFQLGFAVMLGVLLDTFVVRALFVPSLVILLRRWNWWPVRLKSPSSAEADAS
ncbi:MAG: MMPL family transporter [Chloroflexota bacterium]|nr:MMPL family transporter [Chloroflexota bacterium]